MVQTRRAQKTAAIIIAARKCFISQGYGATSMDQVAAEAMVSKATVYAHFHSKEELFGAFIMAQCNVHAEGFGGIPQENIHTLDQAVDIITRYLMGRLLDPDNLAIYRIVMAECYRHPELTQVYYTQGQQRGRALIGEKLTRLSERGIIRIADGYGAADMLIGMLRGECFNRALMGLPQDEKYTPELTIQNVSQVLKQIWAPV